ncbi:MAG: hypothetical protein WCI92_20060 [Bacteroidota bacterium]
MESNNRNNQGRFIVGHKGTKPKGAINKNTRDYLARLDKINNILESNLEENILSLSKKEQVMLWLELQKFMHAKMSKLTEPEPEKERIDKIIFEVVEGDSSQTEITEIQDDLSKPSGAASGTSQPAKVNRQINEPLQYGAVDAGKVRRIKSIRSAGSL